MKKKRLLSLDVYRGMTIAFMIIVNTPGSWQYVYAPLRHSEWHGCTPTDLVFPSFLFIVGVSMWFSMKKYGHNLNYSSVLKIIYRTAIIFAAGFILNWFPFAGKELSGIRIMGVLQRIALAYGIAAFLCILVKRQYLWVVSAIILLSYWALLYFAGGSSPYSLEGNVVLAVDRAILGKEHLYHGFGIAFDPEGLLSTIPAVANVIIGFIAGSILGKGQPDIRKVMKILLWGIALTLAGIVWDIWLPVNKPLWTSSYVLYTSGLSFIILALLYLIIDVFNWKRWAGFFKVFGMNALFIYMTASLWTKTMLLIRIGAEGEKVSLYSWIYNSLCVPVLGYMNGSLMFAILQVLLMWLFVYILYRKRIFIKV